MGESVRVHIWYPHDQVDDDEAWLTATASRHSGELDRGIMLSQPPQRFARFTDQSSATAFADALNETGRWRAGVPHI